MSGNGGGIPDPGPPSEECKKIYKPINLVSSQDEILEKLEKGSNLELAVEQVGGKPSLRVLYQGEYAGSIIKNAAQIIECINRGHQYIAIVISIDGGSCILEVRMVSQT